MEIREVSFFKDFQCLAGDCRETCCHGWMIPLTDEDYDRFLKDEGLLGKRLVLYSKISAGDQRVLNYSCRTCRLMTGKGLCSVQLKKGHNYIPQVCRDYPRFYRNYRFFEERLIDPSCEEGARLLLQEEKLSFAVYEGEPESLPCCTNEDTGFFEALLQTRASVINAFQSIASFPALAEEFEKLLLYSRTCEQNYLSGDTDYLIKQPYESFRYDNQISKRLFPFDKATYQKLMKKAFGAVPLKWSNPSLSKLCKLYFRYDRKIIKSENDLNRLWETFCEKNPEVYRILSSIYCYYLYGYFLWSFEDYSFFRNAALGLIHLNMVAMFSMLSFDSEGELTKDRIALILSCYNKKAYFNEEIRDSMYEGFKESFSETLSSLPS